MAAQRRDLVIGELAGQAGEGADREDLAAVLVELRREAVDRQDNLCRCQSAAGGGEAHRIAVVDGGHRRLFKDRDVARQGIAETAHQGGGLHEDGARRMDGGAEVAGAEFPGHRLGIQHPVGLAEGVQLLGEAFEKGLALARHRRHVLAPMAPVALDLVGGDDVVEGLRCRAG